MLLQSLFLILQVFAQTDFSNHYVYEIKHYTTAELHLLQSLNDKVDFWGQTSSKSILISVSNHLLEEVINTFNKTGMIFEKVHSKSLQQLFDDQISLGMYKKGYHEQYHDLDEIYEFYDSLHSQYPHLTSQFTTGKSFEKREIKGLLIKGVNATASPKRFVFHAGIHAREWIGPATLAWITETLLKGYTNDPAVTELLDSTVLEIIPVLNVDGYAYTHSKNRMWRKNRQPTNLLWCVGTDINRNFDAGWSRPGASSNPCSDAYYGSSAFSALESEAISKWLIKNVTTGYIDFHAFSQLMMYPYGYSCNKQTDMDDIWKRVSKSTTDAIAKVHDTKFDYGPICETIYPASGSSIDWAYETGKVKYPLAFELRDKGKYGFAMPPKYIIPSGEEVYAGLMALFKEIKNEEDGDAFKMEIQV